MTQLTALPVTTKKISDPTSQVAVANGVSISKTSDGVFTLLPAVDHDRILLEVGYFVTEDFADNAGTQTKFKVGSAAEDDGIYGESDSADKTTPSRDKATFGFQSSTDLSYGKLAAGVALIVTATPAAGNGTGGAKIYALSINAPA